MSVAVIIPTVMDRPDFLNEALDSVVRQTVKPNELILSINSRWDIYESINNLNDSIRRMKSDYFIILGDDDRLEPEYIETVTRYDTDIVYTGMKVFGNRGGIEHARVWGDSIKSDTVPFVTAMISKRIFDRVGGFDTRCKFFTDWDFYWSCWEIGATATRIDEPLFMYRVHPDQISNRIDWAENRELVLDKHKVV